MSEATPSVDGRVLRARQLREQRHAQLLAAAGRVFAERGYDGTSLADLLEEASVSRGTFYQYFDSKSTCFAAVLTSFLDRLRRAIRRVDVSAPESPAEQLMGNLVRVLDLLEHEAGLARLLLHDAHGTDADLDQLLQNFDKSVLALIVGSLTTGQRLGWVRSADVELLAVFILGAIKEAFSQAVLIRGEGRTHEQVARGILDFALRGVLIEPSAHPEDTIP